MADETYRPSPVRKPITTDEIESQDNGQEVLDNMAQLRAKISEDDALPTEGIKVTGKMPQEFIRALQSKKNQVEERLPRERPQSSTSTSSKLDDLLAQIKAKTNVYEKVQLPSLGKFYDGTDGPVDGIIHIRPMTGEEEQILATPRLMKRGQAIDMIFKKCMQENYNPEKFLSQDRTYLLIYLRGISYTPEYDVEIKCPFTDRTFATVIDLNSLYVDTCPPDFNIDNLEDHLPDTRFRFRYRLPRGEDEQKLKEYRDRRIKNFDLAGKADDTLQYRTAMLIEEIEGITDILEIQTLIKNLGANDLSYLRNVVNLPPFGVNTRVTIESPFAGQEFEVELPIESDFFFPRAKKKKE